MDFLHKPKPDPEVVNYPLNKEEAEMLLRLASTPEWGIFIRCIQFEAGMYRQAALNTPYGPNALELFRFNQALANNIGRIPLAVIEAADNILNEPNLNDLYDI